MDNEVAGPGEIFVCTDCGRRSKDRLGFKRIHSGWSRTCALHAVRFRESDLQLGAAQEVVGIRRGALPLIAALVN